MMKRMCARVQLKSIGEKKKKKKNRRENGVGAPRGKKGGEKKITPE